MGIVLKFPSAEGWHAVPGWFYILAGIQSNDSDVLPMMSSWRALLSSTK
jgi:hypothetical protein